MKSLIEFLGESLKNKIEDAQAKFDHHHEKHQAMHASAESSIDKGKRSLTMDFRNGASLHKQAKEHFARAGRFYKIGQKAMGDKFYAEGELAAERAKKHAEDKNLSTRT